MRFGRDGNHRVKLMSYGLTFGSHVENGLAVSLLVRLNSTEAIENRLHVGNHIDIRLFHLGSHAGNHHISHEYEKQ